MPNIGPLEIAIVLVIVLIIFGPKQLPKLGRSLGRGMKELKDSLSSVKIDDDDEEEGKAEAKQISAQSDSQVKESDQPQKQRQEQ